MRTLEVNTGIGVFFRQFLQDWPGGFLIFCMLAAWLPDSGNMSVSFSATHWIVTTVREVVSTGPWGTVFDIIVPRHMLRNHGNRVGGVLRQEKCGSQPANSGSKQRVSQRSVSLAPSIVPVVRTRG